MYTLSITIDDVIDALGAFLVPLCDGYEIVRGQSNRTPMPFSPCIVLTELLTVDLEIPSSTHDGVLEQDTIAAPKRMDVQIDFYGADAGDKCNAVKSVFRTPYAPSQFPDGIKPLYCSDGIQSPMISAEQQWQGRWMLTASLQYNPSITVAQQSADSASMGVVGAVDL